MSTLREKWLLGLALGLALAASVPGQARGFLKVIVREGDGTFNDIKHKLGHALSVQVRDQNGQPVPGAEVTFTAPASGASGTFSTGSRASTAKTDMDGIAKVEALRPNTTEGRFNIAVIARLADREGSAAIAQSNSIAVVVRK